MIPKITVFISPTNNDDQHDTIVCKFIKLGFAPLVDANHAACYHWFQKNVTQVPHKLFIFTEEQIYFFSVEDLHEDMDFTPHVLIYFNEGDKISDEEWRSVHAFLVGEFIGKKDDAYEKGNKFMERPLNEIKGLPPTLENKEEDCYGFRMHKVEEKDTVLYEVTKPFTDFPYTSVIREWSKRGHVSFFPSLFVCTSWGVSRNDVPFLEYIWKQLEMVGEFDMDKLLKEATEKCYPSSTHAPDPEPEVYRRSIEDVLYTLQGQQEGIRCGHLSNKVPDEIKERFQ